MDGCKEKAGVLDLRMFDDGGAGGAPGGDGATAGVGGEVAAPDVVAPKPTVVYGKQPTANGAESGKPATSAKAAAAVDGVDAGGENAAQAEFEKLIGKGGQYHDAFASRTQGIINQRFAESKATQEQLGKLGPVVDMIAQRYGVDPKDPQAIMRALEQDNSLYEDEAEQRNMSVESLKEVKRIERENAAYKRQAEEASRQRVVAEATQRWQGQAEKAMAVYPQFDLSTEMNHPETGEDFRSLIKSGVDVKTAFEVIHKDELIGGAIQYAAKTAQKQTMDNIRARGMRPPENGASGAGAAAVVKADPSKWTNADFREVARRVQRGERIEL